MKWLIVIALMYGLGSTPSTFEVKGVDYKKEVVAKGGKLDISQIDFVNSSDHIINLEWKTIENTFPKAWDCSMCQHGRCQIGIPPGSKFKALAPGKKGFIAIHVLPGGHPGKGTVKFKVFDRDHPEVNKIIQFDVVVEG